MPGFKIQHITKYKYDRPVRESANQIKIFSFNKPGQEILSQLLADEISTNIILLDLAQKEKIKSQEKIQLILDHITFDECSPLEAAKKYSQFIFENFKYVKGITNVETRVDEILEFRSGVCQDFAHVLLQLLRTIGIPSRYVSGYICPNKNGMRGEGATHAWIDAYIPRLGWIGLDPTNNCFANEHHIQLAVGRDFSDCTPIKGTFKGPANHELMVYVSVGYEDGTVFEDENEVLMNKEESDKAPVIHIQNKQQK